MVREYKISLLFFAQVALPMLLLVAVCSAAARADTWYYCERDGALGVYPSGYQCEGR
jgi:hypothetical protein